MDHCLQTVRDKARTQPGDSDSQTLTIRLHCLPQTKVVRARKDFHGGFALRVSNCASKSTGPYQGPLEEKVLIRFLQLHQPEQVVVWIIHSGFGLTVRDPLER